MGLVGNPVMKAERVKALTDTFSTLVNPGRKLEQRITELTGITDEDLKDAPYLEGLPHFWSDDLFPHPELFYAALPANITSPSEILTPADPFSPERRAPRGETDPPTPSIFPAGVLR